MLIDQALKNCSILLVEDEVLIGMDIMYELEAAGAEVLHVLSVPTALEAAGRGWSAAVLDINVNGRDVWPVADRLRDAGIPFLFCSGHASHGEIAARYENARLLMKPVNERALIRELAAIAAPQDAAKV